MSIKRWREGHWTKRDWLRFWLHFPVGIITILACQLGWVYGLIFAFGFLVYELNEDMHLTDQAFKDILGWLWGMAFTIIGLLLLLSFFGGSDLT